MMKAEIAVRSASTLGEGSLWDAGKQRLCWLDIVGKRLFIYDPEGNTNRELEIPEMAGTVVPRRAGGLILSLESGIHAFDPESGALEKIADPEAQRSETRYNDGKCDPSGRFWAGTMGRNGEAGLGSLYRLDVDGSVTQILDGVDISNGIAWSPDRRFMYWTDTLKGEIYAFDYDDASGGISNRRIAFKLDSVDGLPDGMTIDAEGMLWAACWEGGKVIRIDPKAGKKLSEVKLPASRVTSCAFGGQKLDRLYITTARMGLGEAELAEQPYAGSLFVCEPGVKGIPAVAYAG